MDQGRLAAYHAFGEPAKGMTDLQPIGIYSIPEVSYVGATEVELTKKCLPYEVGVSRYRELARGQIAGDSYGMLKLLVSTDDLKLLGVHIFGTSATEMVHIGQAVMGCGGTIEYLVDAVFNYPTFSEAYKVAALDVMNKLRALNQFRALSPRRFEPDAVEWPGSDVCGNATWATLVVTMGRRSPPSHRRGGVEMADNADQPEQQYQPDQTGMYELEFPAPQLTSPDGRGR